MSIDYKELLEEAREDKFNELSKKNPFLSLSRQEQGWWIRYWRILQSYEEHILKKVSLGDDEMCWKCTIHRYLTSDHKINNVLDACNKGYNPWSMAYELNYWLKEAIIILDEGGVDWKHYPYMNMMIFCNGDSVNGCTGCDYINRCKLKKRK